MGREVRMVPPGWKHPKDKLKPDGYLPLHAPCWSARAAEWASDFLMWERGEHRSQAWYRERGTESPRYYWQYAGAPPDPDDYMPDWPESERTHFMMYEDCSEGTPISPAFATAEELARWLVDNGASSFADCTATYEQWLYVCQGGWAPSAIIQNGVMRSGVSAMADREKGVS